MKLIISTIIYLTSCSFTVVNNYPVYLDSWEITVTDKDNKELTYQVKYKIETVKLKECELQDVQELFKEIINPVIQETITNKVKTLKTWETKLNNTELLKEINKTLQNYKDKSGCSPQLKTLTVEK